MEEVQLSVACHILHTAQVTVSQQCNASKLLALGKEPHSTGVSLKTAHHTTGHNVNAFSDKMLVQLVTMDDKTYCRQESWPHWLNNNNNTGYSYSSTWVWSQAVVINTKCTCSIHWEGKVSP